MTAVLPLSAVPSIVVISDRVAWSPDGALGPAPWPDRLAAAEREAVEVTGGYLERLPLACVRAGIADHVEVWHHVEGGGASFHRASPVLAYRGFPVDPGGAPFSSEAMLAFLHDHGAPHVLVVLGLGVDTRLLDACARSVRLYNSIDAPSLRVPEEVSARFDLVLTGAQWQSDEVEARHPGMATAILPIGPDFAAPDMFRPLGSAKDYDLIYVAAAQGYKRHDILFDALDRLPRDVRALCVFGYGEMGDELRRDAAGRGLSIDFVGPPGVPFDEVNRLMNRACFGVVCGRDDGAPAIITEYMLAGLPVLANADLACGRDFILPQTGMLASAEDFAAAIMTMRETALRYSPRQVVLERWTWPHSVRVLAPLIAAARGKKRNDDGNMDQGHSAFPGG